MEQVRAPSLCIRTGVERIAPESASAEESGFVHRNILRAEGEKHYLL
jgi:hypothetical protein